MVEYVLSQGRRRKKETVQMTSFRERYVHRAVETLLLARAELVSIQLTAPERRQEAYLRVETAEQRRRLIRCILQATTGTDRGLDSSFHP